MSTAKNQEQVVSPTSDEKAVKAIIELGTVEVEVRGPIQHNGIGYSLGDKVIMSRDDANFHITHGNCTIVK